MLPALFACDNALEVEYKMGNRKVVLGQTQD